MKYIKYLLLIIIVGCVASCSDNEPIDENEAAPLLPKRELRGVWMTTVWGIDWPMGDYNAETQKQKYIDYLDLFVEHHINAVFFQIRGMADSFYESEYEPWSKYITGVAGQKPDYDVLAFLIDEAHKRGIQFHAWLNPYRIATRASKSAAFPELDTKIPANLVKDYETIRVYNPALPEVQTRITQIVKEIITKYDVDGIHMDDYFYPSLSSSEKMNDDAEYEMYGKDKFASIEDFRRDNVNTVVKNIQKTIVETKPQVVFSISPAANNDHNYNDLYADVVKWSQEGWADIIIPQLYFPMGGSESSFNQRLHWWSQFTYKNALMIGYGLYKFGDPNAGDSYQTSDDLKKQFDFAATRPKVVGSILYSAKSLLDNKVGLMDVIKEVYQHPALPPFVGRKTVDEPSVPANVRLSGSALSWDQSSSATQYAVYKSNGVGAVADLIALVSTTTVTLDQKGNYFVTAINRNNVESGLSTLIVY